MLEREATPGVKAYERFLSTQSGKAKEAIQPVAVEKATKAKPVAVEKATKAIQPVAVEKAKKAIQPVAVEEAKKAIQPVAVEKEKEIDTKISKIL